MELPLLSLTLFTPLAGAIALYLVPYRRAWRWMAAVASGLALALAVLTATGFKGLNGASQLEERAPWIPSLGASYHLVVDGLSLPLVLLSALLTFLVIVHAWNENRRPRELLALFLVLETGLLGVFTTVDLLLFYLFWELTLVPMYFIIGVWGEERRIEAALKFFLFTRVGSLAMLLSILVLYLSVEPHTFDLPTIVQAAPYAGASLRAQLVLLGFFVAFAIKLPVVPFHSWLPDAHTEAPTGGSVLLAGVLLKMGGYGLLRLALPTVPEAFSVWSPWIVGLAVVSAVYAAAVAMAQSDLKRLIAISSVNHMSYVMLGIAAAAASWASPAARSAALTGASFQLVAHGVVTGGLFFMAGMIKDRTGTRDIAHLGGLWSRWPVWSSVLAFFMFASLGLPGLAHFAAEVQIALGTLGIYGWGAVGMLLAVFITTVMFLWTLQRTLLGRSPADLPAAPDLRARELVAAGTLVLVTVVLGLAPGPLTSLYEAALQNGPALFAHGQ